MNYKYTKIVSQGARGTIKSYRRKTDENGNDIDETTELGSIIDENGSEICYLSCPSTFTPDEQDEEIGFTQVDLTDSEREALKKVGYAAFKKKLLRKKIEGINDLQDIVADVSDINELTLWGLCKLIKHVLGVETMTEKEKATYLAIADAIITANTAGKLNLQSETESPTDMVSRLIDRSNAISLETKEYKEDLADKGLVKLLASE